MDFKSDFLAALSAPPKLPHHFLPEAFLGHLYAGQTDKNAPLLHLLSGGTIKAPAPYSFDIRSLDCFLLLYTRKGCGKLLIGNHVYTLTQDTLLFMDCHERFRLDIAIEPWEYQVLFLTGNDLCYYYSLLPEKNPLLMPVIPYSEVALAMERLSACEHTDTLTSALMVSHLLHTVITESIVYQLSRNAPPSEVLPTYLSEMRNLFDNSFAEPFSLDDLEERFHISKYRLCREFGAAFDMTPLQYLNRRRIEIAGHLLLTTSLKVHEVGSEVGIDNTNHFIFLFKKFTGTTPLEYKQRTTL